MVPHWKKLSIHLNQPKRSYLKKLHFIVTFASDRDNSYDDPHNFLGIVKSGVLSMPCYLNSASYVRDNANILYRNYYQEKKLCLSWWKW